MSRTPTRAGARPAVIRLRGFAPRGRGPRGSTVGCLGVIADVRLRVGRERLLSSGRPGATIVERRAGNGRPRRRSGPGPGRQPAPGTGEVVSGRTMDVLVSGRESASRIRRGVLQAPTTGCASAALIFTTG